MQSFIGRASHVAGYDVFFRRDTVTVSRDGDLVARKTVPDYGTALSELTARPGLALGWARFPDGAEVVYLYDRHDDNFGYALNLTHPDGSEWGYAPFERKTQPALTTKSGKPIVLRRPTPIANRRTVRASARWHPATVALTDRLAA